MEQFKKWRVMISTVAFIMGVMLLAWRPAGAGIYPVINTADDGSPGTLRWAINEINASAEDDLIVFFPVRGSRTITLEQALPVIESNVLMWCPRIYRVTIERSRAEGTPQFRIFTIAQSKTVTIRGLILTNGYPEYDGINHPELDDSDSLSPWYSDSLSPWYSDSLTPWYSDSLSPWYSDSLTPWYSDSLTPWYNDCGGAILAEEGCALTIKDCVITENHAVDGGGGVFVHSTEDNPSSLTITRSTISDNVSDNYGGGVELYQYGTLTIDKCRMVNNQASSWGGAVFTYLTDNITVTASDISNNSATSGGGIFVYRSADAVFRYSIFNGNTAYGSNGYAFGGGLHAAGGMGETNSLEITDCVYKYNEASGLSRGDGGGIYLNFYDGLATISRCTVSDNTAGTTGGEDGNQGGGIYQRGNMTLMDTTISGNTAIEGNSSSRGGGIYSGVIYNDAEPNSELTAINCTISGNSATSGSGVFIDSEGSATLINSTITENSADEGAVYISESDNNSGPGSVTLSNTIVANQQSGFADCAGEGSYSSDGHNIDSDNTCNLTGGSDMPMTDPMLGPLAYRGGLTLTHALRYGSPAIDAGDCDGGTVGEDQRGVRRPQGQACDIGAFERIRYRPRIPWRQWPRMRGRDWNH